MNTKKQNGEQFQLVAKTLDNAVLSVLSEEQLTGFDRAFKTATAIQTLRNTLTDEYMKPVMAMQGSKLGFKTDQTYPVDKVKDCLIDAVLTGVQPYGNQFNIIAGNMYVTKEGFGYLLSKIKGLKYSIVPTLPRMNMDKGSGAVVMKIEWQIGNEVPQSKEIEFAIKINKFMGADAVIGKATRKARAWLFNQVSDIEITDGEVEDVEYTEVVKSTIPEVSKEEKRDAQFKDFVMNIYDTEELEKFVKDHELTSEQMNFVEQRKSQLLSS